MIYEQHVLDWMFAKDIAEYGMNAFGGWTIITNDDYWYIIN